ncbi:MAG TPA: hypothetical protein VEH06_16315 [Candidatus Bathyarchaeia archaeon]|nr:hypothetical protein [Candidatus Bathyarchaeia archaeon]
MKSQKITHANINRPVLSNQAVAFESRIKVAKGNRFRITIPMYMAKEVEWKPVMYYV